MQLISLIKRAYKYFKDYGIISLFYRTKNKIQRSFFDNYSGWFLKQRPSIEILKNQSKERKQGVLYSIIVPVYNTKPEFLEDLYNSFMNQSYTNWEACLYDGNSTNAETIAVLKDMSQRDKRFNICFGTENAGISGNTNLALSMAKGDYILLCDHDDTIEPDALYCFNKSITSTGAEMLYADEDKMNSKGRRFFEPNFKPDFSPDLLRSRNYICHPLMIKRSLILQIGGLNKGYDGSQDHDLILRASEKANKIVHIPRVLYHWRMLSSSMSHKSLEKCINSGIKAVTDHLKRMNLKAKVEEAFPYINCKYEIPDNANIALILIGDDQEQENIKKPELISEIIYINKSKNKAEQLNNKINNTKAEYILLLDNSLNVIDDTAIANLLMYAQRKDVGLVSSAVYSKNKLLYSGYCIGQKRIVQPLQRGLNRKNYGFQFLEKGTYNVSAVSYKYCMFEKSKFQTCCGFNTEYNELFDVELCIRMLKQGLLHVYTAYAAAEAKKGKDPFSESFIKEDIEKIKTLDLNDPFYNIQLNPYMSDYSL